MSREKDIQELCAWVLTLPCEHWDNPNGAFESSCPFCGVVVYSNRLKKIDSIAELNHNLDCAYLLAQDLSTNGGRKQ